MRALVSTRAPIQPRTSQSPFCDTAWLKQASANPNCVTEGSAKSAKPDQLKRLELSLGGRPAAFLQGLREHHN